jgi:hypothetical protein
LASALPPVATTHSRLPMRMSCAQEGLERQERIDTLGDELAGGFGDHDVADEDDAGLARCFVGRAEFAGEGPRERTGQE